MPTNIVPPKNSLFYVNATEGITAWRGEVLADYPPKMLAAIVQATLINVVCPHCKESFNLKAEISNNISCINVYKLSLVNQT